MVDVDYPVYLQPLHKDLPFLPEKRVIHGVVKSVTLFMILKNDLKIILKKTLINFIHFSIW